MEPSLGSWPGRTTDDSHVSPPSRVVAILKPVPFAPALLMAQPVRSFRKNSFANSQSRLRLRPFISTVILQVHPCKMTVEINGLSRNLDCEFAKLFFLNERTGWAISNAGAKGTGFNIATTRDGGETWESSVVLPGQDPREGSIYFTDENHGSLLTGGKLFYSTDG